MKRLSGRLAGPAALVQLASFAFSLALASVLGASAETDAYYLALSAPILVYGIMMAAIRVGAIPGLTDLAGVSPARFAGASSELVSAVLAGSLALSVVTTLASVALLPLLTTSQHLTNLARPLVFELAPMAVMGGLTGALGAVLSVRGRFVAPVAVLAFDPLIKIPLLILFGDSLGVHALVIGNVMGAALGALVLWGLLRHEGCVVGLTLNLRTPFVVGVLTFSIPLLVGQSVLQVNPILDRVMTAPLSTGSVTVLELGQRIFAVPMAMMASVLIAPVTATWAARYRDGGAEALRASLKSAASLGLKVLPPLVVLGYVLREDLVTVAYQGGEYTRADVQTTADIVGMLLLGLPAQVGVLGLATLFVVRKDSTFPMLVAFANILLNTGLNFALREPLGVQGIALSTSITYTLLCLLYGVRARYAYGELGFAGLGVTARVAVVAGGIVLGGATLLLAVLPPGTERGPALLTVVVVGTIGLLLHVAALFCTGQWRPRRIFRWA